MVRPSGFEDPPSPEDGGRDATAVAAGLAMRKLEAIPGANREGHPAVFLASDTVCVDHQGQLVGTPTSDKQAMGMLRGFVGRAHRVVSAVALRATGLHTPIVWADAASVVWGPIDTRELEAYVESGQWQGKAGGYNLSERVDAGWPINLGQGDDPATVMGLPMRGLIPVLESLGVPRRPA